MTATGPDSAAALEVLTGHRFNDPDLPLSALTHPSIGGAEQRQCYERLEFLGDRVLAVAIAELLYERFPAENEGLLSKRLVGLVRREALAEVGESIGLYRHIRTAASAHVTAGRARESMLADACEALIGAMFLDAGLEPARAFVRRHWEPLLTKNRKPPQDPKTALQEWFQARGLERPVYEVVAQEGPAHAPVFTVEVTAAGGHTVRADGANKRAAEQAAAETLLAHLESGDE